MKYLVSILLVCLTTITFSQSLSGNPEAARRARETRKVQRMLMTVPTPPPSSNEMIINQYDDRYYDATILRPRPTQSGVPTYGNCPNMSSGVGYKGTRSGGYGMPGYTHRLLGQTPPHLARRAMMEEAFRAMIYGGFPFNNMQVNRRFR
jgi:hypothetical protein